MKPLPELPGVTLAAATSVALEATVAALHRSMRELRFGAVKLFTDRPVPRSSNAAIEVIPIPTLDSREAYSRFMLHEMVHAIDTPHVMVVQWDGFVINGARWDRSFLDFDYIGAPWPQFRDGLDVGNGGFSLRSRQLLAALAECGGDGGVAEDVMIGRVLRPALERQGLRFADRATAARFSFERTPRRGHELGFHGAFNLPGLIPGSALSALLDSIEPGLILDKDIRTMLRRCLLRGDWKNIKRLRQYLKLRNEPA